MVEFADRLERLLQPVIIAQPTDDRMALAELLQKSR
jgi:hypothetical protein